MNDLALSDRRLPPPDRGPPTAPRATAGEPQTNSLTEADEARVADAPVPTHPGQGDVAAAHRECGKSHAARGAYDLAAAAFTAAIQLDPNDSEALRLRGQVRERLGRHEAAVADYTAALQIDVDGALALAQQVLALTARGDFTGALAGADESRRLNQQLSASYFHRGESYCRQAQWDRAVADYTRAIQLQPGSARAYLGRSRAHEAKGDFELALADFAEAVALDPANPTVGDPAGAARQLRAAYERATAELDRFRNDFRRAVTDLDGATRPGSPVAAETVADRAPAGDILPYPSQPAPAAEGADDADGIDREYAHRRQRQEADRHYRRGWVLQQQGHLEQAKEHYTLAVAADPAQVNAYLERGQVSRLANQFDEAIADFTKAIELGGGGEAYLRRGNSHAEQGEFDLAFEDYGEAIRLDPGCAAAYLNRGVAYLKVGEHDRADADADRALGIDPTLTRALFVRGVARAKQNDHERALADLDLLLQLEPENVLALNQRGLVHTAVGSPDAAVADFSEALRLDPAFDAALFNRGCAHRLRGAGEEAIADFTEFIRRRPQNAQAYHHRGLAHLGRGDHDAAIADFSQATRLDPTLTKAHQGCLDATRAKYESRLAGALPGPVPTPTESPPGADETRSLSLPTVGEFGVGEENGAVGQEHGDPAAAGPCAGGADAAVPAGVTDVRKTTSAKPGPPSGKLRLHCPECGTAGLLDVRNLHKVFRCPGCHAWWRTGADGSLSKAPPPGVEVEVISNTGRSKHRVPGVAEAPAARPAPAGRPAKPSKDTKPVPKEARLRAAREWLAAAAGTRAGRVGLAVGLLLLVVLVPLALPRLFPSQLQQRGRKASLAWLAGDVEQVKQYVEPSQVEYVERWLKEEPPPKLAGQKPQVDVGVQRNDGNTAEVVVQVRATKENGAPAYLVFRQHWVSRGGVWYLQPTLRRRASAAGGRVANLVPRDWPVLFKENI
jgi:tetratricopeptide (TPR) repeat protein